MKTRVQTVDIAVIGSGPAGQKAAVQAAKAGKKVVICEQTREVGGACVHQGTIPSKALRERAMERYRAGQRFAEFKSARNLYQGGVAELIGEMTHIIKAHDQYMSAQLTRNGIDILHGRASFEDSHTLRVRHTDGSVTIVRSDYVVIATGSRPRTPDNVGIDHENIYDSDSILSLAYLPQTLLVLGGGVIACEYASVFALLGVQVTLIDRYPRPLGFLDADLTSRFLEYFEKHGGVFIGEADVQSVQWDGVSQVESRFRDGSVLRTDKALCALGRISQLDGLRIENSGVKVNDRQLIDVNEAGRTNVPHIYAAGDVVGPPSLASASMEQGRRVACDILGVDPGRFSEYIPTGIYAVPELASVGLTEVQARQRVPGSVVGRANFREIARGQIAQSQEGMLKLVVGPDRTVLGIHTVGSFATELVHIGQMGLLTGAKIDVFIENVFNFPTYAESYRVAALDAAGALAQAAESSDGEAVA
ncbi:MAG: Si-specific NAD(P)(+) transhydrogenase [Pseudomonadales bacterium]